jgi:hypothetical protein
VIRQATAKDMPELIILFTELLAYLQKMGNKLYTADDNIFMGGVMEFLIVKHHDPTSVILVQTDELDKPVAFVVGWIIQYPKFFKDCVLGEIQFMSNIGFKIRPLLDAFDAWAQDRGATARSSYATPEHETSWKMMERNGMKRGLHHYYKRYAA